MSPRPISLGRRGSWGGKIHTTARTGAAAPGPDDPARQCQRRVPVPEAHLATGSRTAARPGAADAGARAAARRCPSAPAGRFGPSPAPPPATSRSGRRASDRSSGPPQRPRHGPSVSPAPVGPPPGPGPVAARRAGPAVGPPGRARRSPRCRHPPPAAPAAPTRRAAPPEAAPVLLAAVLAAGARQRRRVVARPGPVAGWLGGDATPAADAPARPSPPRRRCWPARTPSAPAPTPDGVRAALDPLIGVAALGDRVNVSVADVVTGESLYAKGADDGTVPASIDQAGDRGDRAGGPWPRLPDPHPGGRRREPGRGGDHRRRRPDAGGGQDRLLPRRGPARHSRRPGASRRSAAPPRPGSWSTASLFPGPVYGPGWDADIPTGGFGAPITALMTDGARRDPVGRRRSPAPRPPSGSPSRTWPPAGPSPGCSACRPSARWQRGTAPPAAAGAPASGAPRARHRTGQGRSRRR